MSFQNESAAENYEERRQAELLLIRARRNEDTYAWWKEETDPYLKASYAECYREEVGVHPERRDQLLNALSAIQKGRRLSVESVLSQLR